MAGARIELEVDTREAQTVLQQAVQSLGPTGLAPLLSMIGEYLLGATRDRAARELSPDGQHWRALEPSYRRWKEKKRPGVPILKFDNHMLGDQLSWQLDGDAAVLVGTNAVYGAIHQFGSRDPNRRLHPRPWLGVSTDDEGNIVQLVLDHLHNALSGPTA